MSTFLAGMKGGGDAVHAGAVHMVQGMNRASRFVVDDSCIALKQATLMVESEGFHLLLYTIVRGSKVLPKVWRWWKGN
ncbi:hypothetical protein COLO4_17091 [Corchorus olitorius]|uniref:Uncharacterized protein n=1 Tax=Corchorus olitorius TaxID=93759 RepID=A0A1R3JE63_9ROSI|nr:hypothetical protein COLO4_17091 [Corchorus olitorius]